MKQTGKRPFSPIHPVVGHPSSCERDEGKTAVFGHGSTRKDTEKSSV
ncbi:MAG: hypothetical protein H6668_04400 [Ardenticatenaceae bacterium]|nr:hypothetical protein [Ardenticatenaceae bacterium]